MAKKVVPRKYFIYEEDVYPTRNDHFLGRDVYKLSKILYGTLKKKYAYLVETDDLRDELQDFLVWCYENKADVPLSYQYIMIRFECFLIDSYRKRQKDLNGLTQVDFSHELIESLPWPSQVKSLNKYPPMSTILNDEYVDAYLTHGTYRDASKALGMNKDTLWRRLRKRLEQLVIDAGGWIAD